MDLNKTAVILIGYQDDYFAGVVTSICIDSTGRFAMESGYRVHILTDCTASRTTIEQSFFCEKIFPLYAMVNDSAILLARARVVDG